MGFAAALSLLPARLAAQEMDYGALQELFGEPVTLSATGSPQRVADAPVDMEIITAEDIRRSGADNVPDVLRQVTGIDLRRYGASDADIGIRGYNSANSPRVLVLLNGRQIYVDYHSYTAWATLPVQIEEIRQIEVVKGPNCALFGFNAVSGVINIVTYDPIHDTLHEAVVKGGSIADRQISAIGSGHWGDQAGLRLSAGEHGSAEQSTTNQPVSYQPFPSHAFSRNAYAQSRVDLPAGVNIAAEADFTEAKQFEMTVGGYPGPTAYQTNREKLSIGNLTALGNLDLSLTRNAVNFQYFPGENCITCISINNEVEDALLSDLLKIGASHILRLTLEYQNNRVTGSAFGTEKLSFALAAASVMWNWQVSPEVALTNSLRVDNMQFRFAGPVASSIVYSAKQYDSAPITEPTFNSAIVYRPTAFDSVRLSLARAAQVPDFYALFPEPLSTDPAYSAGAVTAFQGTPNLKPTVIMNYEADYQRTLPSLQSALQLSLFTLTSRDVLAPPGDSGVIDPATDYGYAGNIGSSRAIGGEFGIKGSNPQGWRWRAGYAAVFIADDLSVNRNPSLPNSSIDNQRGTPKHVVTLGLGRSWDDFEADLAGRWQSGFSDIRVGNDGVTLTRFPVKDYVTLDGRVGYRPHEWVLLSVSGQQLNQSRLLQSSGPPVEQRVIGSVTFSF